MPHREVAVSLAKSGDLLGVSLPLAATSKVSFDSGKSLNAAAVPTVRSPLSTVRCPLSGVHRTAVLFQRSFYVLPVPAACVCAILSVSLLQFLEANENCRLPIVPASCPSVRPFVPLCTLGT